MSYPIQASVSPWGSWVHRKHQQFYSYFLPGCSPPCLAELEDIFLRSHVLHETKLRAEERSRNGPSKQALLPWPQGNGALRCWLKNCGSAWELPDFSLRAKSLQSKPFMESLSLQNSSSLREILWVKRAVPSMRGDGITQNSVFTWPGYHIWPLFAPWSSSGKQKPWGRGGHASSAQGLCLFLLNLSLWYSRECSGTAEVTLFSRHDKNDLQSVFSYTVLVSFAQKRQSPVHCQLTHPRPWITPLKWTARGLGGQGPPSLGWVTPLDEKGLGRQFPWL